MNNYGQTASNAQASTGGFVTAQAFTTGSDRGGYTLTRTRASITNNPTTAQRGTVRAELWSASDDGDPDAKLHDLTVPPSLARRAPRSATRCAAMSLVMSSTTGKGTVGDGSSVKNNHLRIPLEFR